MPKTGATRYQKFLKSEKSKTKLKSKKDLPKGTNVTKTNFKIKKIVIREQLKKHTEAEALSTRKLNVKELLSRLSHFNTHSRLDALNGLKELITSHPDTLQKSLGEVIHGIMPLVLNIEKSVRHECFKVIHLILSNTDDERIDPFFDIMCTYLRSAMTHIDGRIQEDSLLLLDTLLLLTPKKVSQDFHKIIPNFLDMISKLRVDSKPGRMLTVNLGSQITSVKWRVKVLHRLQDYLNKFIKFSNINITKEEVVETTRTFDFTKPNYFSLFNPKYLQYYTIPCFPSRNMQDSEPLDEVEKMKAYVDTLMPLLIETWLEVCPNENTVKNIETVINEDAAYLLKHSLEVMSLIFNLVKHFNSITAGSDILNIFLQKYRQPYLKHFVKSFPYVTNMRSKQRNINSSSLESSILDPKLVEQNLEICHLFIVLNPNINVKNQNNDVISILNYIEKSFNHKTEDNISDIIMKILHTIFSNNINSWTRNLSVMDALFKKIVWVYFNKDVSSQLRQKIFSVLCKIALNDKLTQFHNCDTFNTWLKNLPDILLEDKITVQTLDIIHMFAVRNNATFCSVIKPKLIKIVANLPNIQIYGANNVYKYNKLLSLLYYIKDWDPEALDLLEKQLLDNAYGEENVNFILDTLNFAHLNK